MSDVPPEPRSAAQAALQQRGLIAGAVLGDVAIGRAHPNPDTFSGLLARFDLYLSELAKAEEALERHANLLVAPDASTGKVDVNALNAPMVDEDTTPVIWRLQQRLDRMAGLTGMITQHHERANRVF